ncbi:hypothetical protein [Synechococcus elongatus]|uniref:LA2681-like HEPN domain-containing protein n=1 Tax=Synechococcus elongatus PCC 11801 TaxID=2219813 RepID=A0AAN1UTK9_SYNEL|nr:hypothetical protein [Synechococcus elongatus]AZB71630.1 hypothetical protein DOP62_01830 [Synechococcus elongatus PCC 11801]
MIEIKVYGQNLDCIISNGISALRRNLETFPSFDPTLPYEEKDAYIQGPIQIGNYLLTYANLYQKAEEYFDRLIQEIEAFESESGKTFNKGMVYANLGIAQIIGKNFDQGIAHLLWASEEDKAFSRNPHGIIESDLWKQFENQYIFPLFINLNTIEAAELSSKVDKIFIERLLRYFDLEHRLLLEVAMFSICENLKFNRFKRNKYTQVKMYMLLRDLCILIEALLRKKYLTNYPNGSEGGSLFKLLEFNLSIRGFRFNNSSLKGKNRAQGIQEFLDKLDSIFQSTEDLVVKQCFCLALTRNFTSHHLDISNEIRSESSQFTLSDVCETIIVNLLSVLLYFYAVNAV